MKTKILMIAITLSLGFIACEKPNNKLLQEQQISEVTTKDAIFPTEMTYEQRLVAKVQKDGHELEFYTMGDKDRSGILTLEQVYGDAEINEESHYTIVDDGSTPFDHFIRLTNTNVAVPLEIAQTAQGNALETSGRNTTNLTEPLMILDKNFTKELQNRGCTDLGYNGFRERACGGSVISTPTDIKFCDSGTWTWLNRASYFDGTQKVRTVTTKTNVICGLVRVEFLLWYDGKWNLGGQIDLVDGGWSVSAFWPGEYAALVKRSRPNNSGSFRAYTRFSQ